MTACPDFSGSYACRLLGLLMLIVLAGCGGGGGNSPSASASFSIGGTVSGLSGTGLRLQLNGSQDLAIVANGSFVFPGSLSNGASFAVTLAGAPTSPVQPCTVSGATGTVSNANVTSVSVACGNPFTLGGQVTGLSLSAASTGVVLRTAAGDSVTVRANGAFEFPVGLPFGATYSVSVQTSPSLPNQTCALTGQSGTIPNADVTSVNVTCSRSPGVMAFVANTTGSVTSYRIGNGAALSPVLTVSAAGARDVEVDPSGRFLVAARLQGGAGNLASLSVYSIHLANGVHSEIAGSPFTTAPSASTVAKVAIDPTGRFVYVANTFRLSAYALNPTTGVLTELPGSPYKPSVGFYDLQVDPLGRFLYVSAVGSVTGAGDLWVYRIDPQSGVLAPIAGAPFSSGGEGAQVIAIDPGGTRLYASHGGFTAPPKIARFTLGADGTPQQQAGVTLTPGDSALSLAVDRTGGFLVSGQQVGAAADNVAVYSISPTDGGLAAVAGSPFAGVSTPRAIAADPARDVIYIANDDDPLNDPLLSGVGVFSLDRTNGALAPVPGAAAQAGNTAVSISVH